MRVVVNAISGAGAEVKDSFTLEVVKCCFGRHEAIHNTEL